jgi:hypothetical protein
MANNTILMKGDLGRRYEEARVKTGVQILPGMLIEKHTDGTVQPHAGEGLSGALMIAIEDGLNGGTIDTPYLAGDLCRYITLAQGEEAQMLLFNGQTSVIGGPLTSKGDGTLRVGVSGTDSLLFRANEVVAASGANVRVKVTAGPFPRT